MKTILISLLLVMSSPSFAQDPRIKSWKTLVNDNGYEFKYPDCWNLSPDNEGEFDQSVTEAKDVAAEETESCARPQMNPPRINHVGFSAGWTKTPEPKTLKKELDWEEKVAKGKLLIKELGFFKRTKIDSHEALIRVMLHKGPKDTNIYWSLELYCPTNQVSFSGAAIKNPDPSYFEKFKAGDLAMPEPEKTIFESIHCVEPKKK